MAHKNERDKTGEAFSLGENAECSFVQTCNKYGYKTSKSSRSEEFKHIDFHLETPQDHKFSIEVKSRKKVKRNDSSVNDELVWVEFKNIVGARGWLYGSADFVAFEREKDFLIVNRKSLVRLCEKLVDLTQINVNTKLPLYTGYQRSGRKDLVSLIKISDILFNIKYSLLTK